MSRERAERERLIDECGVLADADVEATERTSAARAAFSAALRAAESDDVAIHPDGRGRLVLSDGTEVRVHIAGQSSAAAHGWHGMQRHRLSALQQADRDGTPVLLGFYEGPETWWVDWVHRLPNFDPAGKRRELPAAISYGEDGKKEETARWGWPCRVLTKMRGLRLPRDRRDVPPRVERPQGELFR